MAVAPRDHAERDLQKPPGKDLKAPADDGAHQKDDREVLLVKAVERDGEEHRADAVDGAKGSKEHARAVLPYTGFHDDDVPDLLEYQSQEARDHKDPEQVEEVELDVALAGLVAPEQALACGVAVHHVAQAALQFALLAKRRVDADGERDQDEELHAGADDLRAQALQHDVDDELHEGVGDEHVGERGGIAAAAADEGRAKGDERDGAHGRERYAQDDKAYGEHQVIADGNGARTVGKTVEAHAKEPGHRRERGDAREDAEYAVDFEQQADAGLLARGRHGGVELIARVGALLRRLVLGPGPAMEHAQALLIYAMQTKAFPS